MMGNMGHVPGSTASQLLYLGTADRSYATLLTDAAATTPDHRARYTALGLSDDIVTCH